MKWKLKLSIACLCLLTLPFLTWAQEDQEQAQNQEQSNVTRANVPIENITRVDGVRSNQLRGFGIITGLSGTGDGQIAFVNRAISNALKQLGISIENPQDAQLDNIASVLVTADLPAFKTPGDRINVTVSSLGNADDLTGGVLMQTPLKANNGNVYAVAQGPITKGGDAEDRDLTTVRMPNGALVEKKVPFEFVGRDHMMALQLKNPGFTTATRISKNINQRFELKLARPKNAGTVRIKVPQDYRSNPVQFISMVERISVRPNQEAKIVINERTGTVIMGGNLSIRPVSISHGDLSIQVEGEEEQAQGESVVLPQSTTVQQVVNSLNNVGASTDSVIAILEAMDQAGALNAPLEVM